MKGFPLGTAKVISSTGVKLDFDPKKGLGKRRPKMEWTDGTFADQLPSEPDSLTFAMNLRTVNVTNAREHWAVRKKRTNAEHAVVATALKDKDLAAFRSGCVCRMVRVSYGRLDDDGLRAALKGIRDAVAVALFGGRPGQYDSHAAVTWSYGQLRGPKGRAGVIVTLMVAK